MILFIEHQLIGQNTGLLAADKLSVYQTPKYTCLSN